MELLEAMEFIGLRLSREEIAIVAQACDVYQTGRITYRDFTGLVEGWGSRIDNPQPSDPHPVIPMCHAACRGFELHVHL